MFFSMCVIFYVMKLVGARHFDNLSAPRHEIWVRLAVDYVRNVSCDNAFFAIPSQCRQMKQTAVDQMNVYAAEAGKNKKLVAVAPDGSLRRSGQHDGVVIVDPFPAASFGHLVLAFFVDRMPNTNSRADCEVYGGIFVENHDCLRLMLKDGCHNLLDRQQRYRHYVRTQAWRKIHRCEVDFLPNVYEIDAAPASSYRADFAPVIAVGQEQILRCREVADFARCPDRLPQQPNGMVAQQRGSRNLQPETTTEQPPIRCRLFETCDHAVVVHGSWGRLTSRKNDFNVLSSTKRMLSENGFPEGNVKLFYKNGLADGDNQGRSRQTQNSIESTNLYPADDKQMLRSHIKNSCSRSHCVDTLAVFFKGPALEDGSLLLYDTDGNGVAGENEMYTLQEFLDDLTDCQAKRVFVVADFSYSGRLTSLLRRRSASSHRNLVAVTSGDDEQFSWDGQFTASWMNQNHRSTCFKGIFMANKDLIPRSEPTIFDGGEDDDDVEDSTIFGAPCNRYPPLTDEELREKYLGCNNVPSSVWFQNISTGNRVSNGSASSRQSRRIRR